MWRKQAVADAGGFTWESVTEDILLSYKAYMSNRYEFSYVPDHPQCLEVPADVLAHIQQKHRWTKGYLQVFRLHWWDMLISTKIPFAIKYEFFVHVLGALQLVFSAISLILFMHLKMPGLVNCWTFKFYIVTSTLENFLTPLLAHTSKRAGSSGHYKSILSRICRLRFYVPFCTWQMGMTLFETKAAIEGAFSNDATFLTTPKSGAQNSVKQFWVDDLVAYLGLVLSLHQFVFNVLNDPFDEIESSFVRRSMWFSNATLTVGLVCVSISFLWAKHSHLREKKRRVSESAIGPLVGFCQ